MSRAQSPAGEAEASEFWARVSAALIVSCVTLEKCLDVPEHSHPHSFICNLSVMGLFSQHCCEEVRESLFPAQGAAPPAVDTAWASGARISGFPP